MFTSLWLLIWEKPFILDTPPTPPQLPLQGGKNVTFKTVYTNQREALALPDSKKHETVLELGRRRGAWARSGSNQGQEFTDRIKQKAGRAGGVAGHALSIQRGKASAGSSIDDLRQPSAVGWGADIPRRWEEWAGCGGLGERGWLFLPPKSLMGLLPASQHFTEDGERSRTRRNYCSPVLHSDARCDE